MHSVQSVKEDDRTQLMSGMGVEEGEEEGEEVAPNDKEAV